MKLFETINALFIGTRYLSWGIAVAGIVGSVILFFMNLSLGMASALVFVAAFLLALGVTLLLLPMSLAKGILSNNKKRSMAGGVALFLAVIIMGITYFAVGGFPELNLLFI